MIREPAEVSLRLHNETEKAILVSDDGDEGHAKWLPLSLVEVEHGGQGRYDDVTVTMPAWLAVREGFV